MVPSVPPVPSDSEQTFRRHCEVQVVSTYRPQAAASGEGRGEPTGSAPCHLPEGHELRTAGEPGCERGQNSSLEARRGGTEAPTSALLPAAASWFRGGHCRGPRPHGRALEGQGAGGAGRWGGGCRAPRSAAPPAGKAGQARKPCPSLHQPEQAPGRPTSAPLNQGPGPHALVAPLGKNQLAFI